MLVFRAGKIHPTHDPVRFDSLRSRFNSIRFDSNEYITIANRYSINHFVPNSLNNILYIRLFFKILCDVDSKSDNSRVSD